MKLLIITQVIDTEHPVLGFFHRWVEEFAQHCEHVEVIALHVGKFALPANVTVHSLGKERGAGRLTYLWRFYCLVIGRRHAYDHVFVHMNDEYIVLAGLWWKLRKKTVTLWRNHYVGHWYTYVACMIANRVWYTSQASYTAKFSNAVAMPIGIDTKLFTPASNAVRPRGSFLYVGRITASKRVDSLLSAFAEVYRQRPETTLTIVGPSDGETYLQELKQYAQIHALPVRFIGSVPWQTLPTYYSNHELLINLSPPGMFDKVLGEALACGCDVVTTNTDLVSILKQRVLQSDIIPNLSSYLTTYCYDIHSVTMVRAQCIEVHSLTRLVQLALQDIHERSHAQSCS
jgi:glycosyltransferase involved in cell wall biosynthesis